MSTTSLPQDRACAWPVTGGIPAQRGAPPEPGTPPVTAPATEPVTAPPLATLSPQAVRALRKATLLAQAMPTVRPTSAPWRPVPPVPAEAPPVVARPIRTAPARAATRRHEPARRRWPSVVGGLAAGLTLGTLGAFGAVLALSALVAPPTVAASTALSGAPDSVSPNVSVPGRVRTTFGDGTWQVGVDVAPGRYATSGAVDGGACRHALRSARTGGTVTAAAGATTVVLTEADGWFTTSGCATWTRVG